MPLLPLLTTEPPALSDRTRKRIMGYYKHGTDRSWRPFAEEVDDYDFFVDDITICYCTDLAQHRYLALGAIDGIYTTSTPST